MNRKRATQLLQANMSWDQTVSGKQGGNSNLGRSFEGNVRKGRGVTLQLTPRQEPLWSSTG